MTLDYEIMRHAAYFRGWCQSFGEHESLTSDSTGISWLFSEGQAGFILPEHLTRSLYHEVLGKGDTPVLELSEQYARVGAFHFPLSEETDRRGIAAIKNILEAGNGVSLFLTSHFMYGTEARIITLSNNRPLAIIYKEVGPMTVRMD